MKPVAIGYIGCGFLAQKVHIPNIVGLGEVELVAIAEPRGDLLEQVGRRHGVRRMYTSHLELAADPEIEAVMISGHYSGQGELAIDALTAGKHVLLEKPMATSLEQADRILAAEAGNDAGARLMVAYMKRYDPGYRLLRSLLTDASLTRELGEAILIRYHNLDGGEWLGGLDTPLATSELPLPQTTTAYPEWLEVSRRERYVLYLQQYTHNINLIRWLFGVGDRIRVRHVDLDDDDYTGIVIFDVDGRRAVLETGVAESNTWDDELQIFFERGWLKATAAPLLLRNQPVTVQLSRLGARAGEVRTLTPTEWLWSYREEVRHFATALRTGEAFESPGSDTRTDVRIFEDIFRRG
jgi:predicted dehydrogenase